MMPLLADHARTKRLCAWCACQQLASHLQGYDAPPQALQKVLEGVAKGRQDASPLPPRRGEDLQAVSVRPCARAAKDQSRGCTSLMHVPCNVRAINAKF
jgi:hypothetical protein